MAGSLTGIAEVYRSRVIEPLPLWEPDGWRIKPYVIRYGDAGAGAVDVVAVARETLVARLPPIGDTDHYGVGFAGLHFGRTANFIFIDWWACENELHHHVFVSSLASPSAFRDATASGLAACVWDLELIWFERQAWTRHALGPPGQRSVAAYLAERIAIR
ncbi:MAG TPA: isochorismatase [Thermoanaerobaculia bacterium]|nr:isochorismatase [Thermoanaerobaculia bacterium]